RPRSCESTPTTALPRGTIGCSSPLRGTSPGARPRPLRDGAASAGRGCRRASRRLDTVPRAPPDRRLWPGPRGCRGRRARWSSPESYDAVRGGSVALPGTMAWGVGSGTRRWGSEIQTLAQSGHPVGSDAAQPSLNARFMAWLGRRFGPRYLLPLLLREEGREVKGYMDLHRQSSTDDARSVSLTLAKESAAHAETLANLAGRASEPWHRTGSGGFLRNVVYGFNDGLTANFGLVAGVLGAAVAPHIVLVSGLAGMIADA